MMIPSNTRVTAGPGSSTQAPHSRRGSGLRYLLLAPCAVLLCLGAVLAASVTFPYLFQVGKTSLIRLAPQFFTRPLPKNTSDYLSTILETDPTDPRCLGEQPYSYQFFDDLKQRYPTSTYRQIVEAEMGTFLVSCDQPEVTPSDGTFQSCTYDFLGDGHFTLSFAFAAVPNESGFEWVVWRVCSYNMVTWNPFATYSCNR